MRTNLAINPANVNTHLGRLAIAHNAFQKATSLPTPYFIERAVIKEDHVAVFYIDENVLNSGIIADDDWMDTTIGLGSLQKYVREVYSCASLFSDLTVHDFIEYNLNEVVKGYIEAGKEINYVK